VEFNGKRDVRRILNVILAGAVLVVFFGLVESATERNVFALLAPAGSSDADYIASAVASKYREGYRVQGAFLHPLVLAEYLVLVFPVAAYFLFQFSGSLRVRMSAAFVVIPGFLVLLHTGSRSGLVAFGVQAIMILIFLLHKKMKKTMGLGNLLAVSAAIGAVFAVIALGYIYAPQLLLGRDSAEASSTFTRLLQLQNGIGIIEKKPIIGTGPGVGGRRQLCSC
jgi:O-antigen ligase